MSDFKRSCKFLWQRLTRGWDDRETWNLDRAFALYILPRLKGFRDMSPTHPHELTPEQWQWVIDQMIFSFEWYATPVCERVESVETYLKVFTGMDLFAKWYGNLWW
jgi:hypothetical protein